MTSTRVRAALTMRTFVLAGMALLAFVEVHGMYNYHEIVGIPAALRIKIQEDEFMNPHTRNSKNAKIVGPVAPSKTYPYLAGLLISLASNRSLCGASLISTTRLVTAAHCWFDGVRTADKVEVVLGSDFVYYFGTRVTTSHVVAHPGYDKSTNNNDVAVIYLPNAVTLSDAIQPISLPSRSQLSDKFENEWVYAAGYGETKILKKQSRINKLRTKIHHARLRVMSNDKCDWYPTKRPYNIFTTGPGIRPGDSGGPLVLKQDGRDILIGIASYIPDNANNCSGFTRITSFYNYIMQNMENNTTNDI